MYNLSLIIYNNVIAIYKCLFSLCGNCILLIISYLLSAFPVSLTTWISVDICQQELTIYAIKKELSISMQFACTICEEIMELVHICSHFTINLISNQNTSKQLKLLLNFHNVQVSLTYKIKSHDTCFIKCT